MKMKLIGLNRSDDMMFSPFADSILLTRSSTGNDLKGHIACSTYDCSVTRCGFVVLIVGGCAMQEEGEESRPIFVDSTCQQKLWFIYVHSDCKSLQSFATCNLRLLFLAVLLLPIALMLMALSLK